MPVNRFNHNSWMHAVTPTDRSKSVHNRCVIEVFVAILCFQIFTLQCHSPAMQHKKTVANIFQ